MIKASVTVAELSTTQPINSMILNGQLNTNVNGINIQNGLATQINAKVSSIEWFIQLSIKIFNYSREAMISILCQAWTCKYQIQVETSI